LWHQKLEGQVTKCRWFHLVFYVRENLDSTQAFFISANERQGDKGGSTGYGRPSLGRNILEVATTLDRDWPTAADVVRCCDLLKRPVRRHRTFTASRAEKLLTCRSHALPQA
jgi:hypothetical protein